MKAPRGFAKNYFTLSAIQAYSTGISMHRSYIRGRIFIMQTSDELDEEPTEDDLETTAGNELLCSSSHGGHCSCRHSTVAYDLIRQNPKPKLLISPYIFTNSSISPPSGTFFSNQKKQRKIFMKKPLLSLAAALSLSASLSANSTITLEPLTVTTSAVVSDELNAPEAVEIFTQEDIEKARVQTLYQFLNEQSSVIAIPAYGNPMLQKLDLHGYGNENGYQNIVVKVNGRRMNNIDMVPQLLASIPPSSIERIEILKGSGIVTGGDGANAGVINIITKRSNDKEVTFYLGNHSTFSGSAYVGYANDKVSLSVLGDAYRSNGARTVNANGDTDEQKMSNGRFDIGYTPSEAVELRAGAQFSKTDSTYGGYLTLDEYEDDPSQAGATNWGPTNQKYESNVADLGFTYGISSAWTLHADASHEKKKSEYITYATIARYTYDSIDAGIDFNSDLLEFTIGFDGFKGERDSGATAFSLANTTEKNSGAGYLMSQWHFGSSTLKAGVRYDRISYSYSSSAKSLEQSDDLWGAELGYNYLFSKTASVFINYSHSYQAPDVDRFFTPDYSTTPPGVKFNGFIEPMEADTYTIGLSHILKSNKFKLSVYYTDIEDEIYYYSDPGFIHSTNTNIDKSYKYGLDLYDKWLISRSWNLALNYNYVKAVIDKEEQNGENYSGNELPGVPNHNVKIALSFLPDSYSNITISQLYRSEAYAANDFNNDFSQKQDAFYSTNLSGSYARDNYEVFAKINNLFNQGNGMWIKDDTIYPVNFTTSFIAGFKLKY